MFMKLRVEDISDDDESIYQIEIPAIFATVPIPSGTWEEFIPAVQRQFTGTKKEFLKLIEKENHINGKINYYAKKISS
jgi:hypothetical protein